MNPRQRRLRRQRRKARVRDAEEARLELLELKRKADSVMAQGARSVAKLARRLGQDLTPKERAILSNRGVVLPDPQSDIGPAISPKPTGGSLLAAMLKGEKA